jgi:hypothetical protein
MLRMALALPRGIEPCFSLERGVTRTLANVDECQQTQQFQLLSSLVCAKVLSIHDRVLKKN